MATSTLDQRKTKYLAAKKVYYSSKEGKTLMSDAQFDKLEDSIREEDPNWKGFKAGAPINKKTKVKLPIPIFSLKKVKTDTVDKWLANQTIGNVVISDKLDGSSLEIEYSEGRPVFCGTRGNGIIGGDISFVIPHLKIPQRVGTSSFIVRCEGLFSKANFQKYKTEFDSARNAASGILNRQDIHHSMKDLRVVVLQVLRPNMMPSKGLAWAKSKGFTVVPNKTVPLAKLTANNLNVLLVKRKASSKFAMDGLVITLDAVNKLPTSGDPDWAVAFKPALDIDSAPITIVREVEWEVSAHGLIKPVVIYDPIYWDGSTLTRASAYNAKYVKVNSIGVGSKVALVRSGDVIPKIVKVITKAKKTAVPDPMVFGAYHYTKNETDYVLTSPLENEDFRVKKISRFFTNIGVDFLREKTVRKLYASGFTNVKSITRATAKQFLQVPGVKIATANKIWSNIHKIIDAGISVVTLMDASGVFPSGMGSTRFETISKKYDLLKLCTLPKEEQLSILLTIPGFKDATADYFIRGSKKFLKWMSIVGITPVAPPKATKVKLDSKKLQGISVSFTGYRNKDQEAVVVKNGGSVVSFGAKTQTLLVSPSGKASTKQDKAEEKGISVMTWDKFARKYKL